MCKFCDEESVECCIWKDWRDDRYFLDITTGEWDNYNDDFVHCREYIRYCPFCGRRLEEE